MRSFAPMKDVNYREPARQCRKRVVGGWTIELQSELADDHPHLTEKALARLEAKLAQTLRILPPHAAPILKRLPIYLMLGQEATLGGRDNGGEYFQRIAPDFFPQTDLKWRSVIVIYSARNYVGLDEGWAVRILLHELAHAWHLEQRPEEQPEIHAAWENAVTRNLYTNVRAQDGSTVEKSYALANQLEYFAELSMSHFWRGEYEPFDRAALATYDPEGFAMLEKMWGENRPPAVNEPR